MCFYIDLKYPKKKIAKRDITCYKILWDDYESIFQHKKYETDKLYNTKIGSLYSTFTGGPCIEQGFHSYSNLKEAISMRVIYATGFHYFIIKNLNIVKCIIPKNSEYYYNSERKEYVSNQIILQEVIKY